MSSIFSSRPPFSVVLLFSIFSSRHPVLGRTGINRVKPIVNRLAVYKVFSLTDGAFARDGIGTPTSNCVGYLLLLWPCSKC